MKAKESKYMYVCILVFYINIHVYNSQLSLSEVDFEVNVSCLVLK